MYTIEDLLQNASRSFESVSAETVLLSYAVYSYWYVSHLFRLQCTSPLHRDAINLLIHLAMKYNNHDLPRSFLLFSSLMSSATLLIVIRAEFSVLWLGWSVGVFCSNLLRSSGYLRTLWIGLMSRVDKSQDVISGLDYKYVFNYLHLYTTILKPSHIH